MAGKTRVKSTLYEGKDMEWKEVGLEVEGKG